MKLIRTIFSFVVAGFLVSSAPVPSGYQVGDKVQDFKLKNFDGKMVSMSDYRDAKGFIVIFDCNTCPYSKAYNERIIALSKKYTPLNFPVITINANDPSISPGDSFDEMRKQAEKKGYDFPYLIDETQNVARAFGATNTPHVFVLNKVNANEFRVAYIGAIDDNSRNESAVKKKYVEDAVEALLNGKSVSETKTKAIGCTIKWRDA